MMIERAQTKPHRAKAQRAAQGVIKPVVVLVWHVKYGMGSDGGGETDIFL